MGVSLRFAKQIQRQEEVALHDTIIIAENVTVVNAPVQETAPEYIKKWTDHKQMNEAVAAKMYAIGYKERAFRMYECAKQIIYNHCSDCDTYSIARTNLCRDRFCPTCNWRLALQRYVSMTKITQQLMQDHSSANYSFITLTVKNCAPTDLSATMTLMSKSWNRLLQRVCMKDEGSGAAGWAKSVEITYNAHTHMLHPHYHVLILWKQADRSREVVGAWLQSCVKSGLEASIKAQDWQAVHDYGDEGSTMAAAICETFKYAIKSKQLHDMPYGEFKLLVDEIGGKRLTSFGGIIKQIAAQMDVDMESLSDESVTVCRHCGSTDVDQIVYKWAFGKYEREHTFDGSDS